MQRVGFEKIVANDSNTKNQELGEALINAFHDKTNVENLRNLVHQNAPVNYRLDYGLPIRVEAQYVAALFYLLEGDKENSLFLDNITLATSQDVCGANNAEEMEKYTKTAIEFFTILNAEKANFEDIPLNPAFKEFVIQEAIIGRAHPFHTNGSLIVAAGLEDLHFIKNLVAIGKNSTVVKSENGSDINFRGYFGGNAATHSAILLDIESLEFLLQNGSEIGCYGIAGASLLHWVAVTARLVEDQKGQTKAIECAKCLLKYGADPLSKNLFGRTPIDYARGSLKEFLIRNSYLMIPMQSNHHARDYVYEMSVHYLTARCIQLASEIQLSQIIVDGGITFDELMQKYPSYDSVAMKQFIQFLATRKIFIVVNDRIFPSRLSRELLTVQKTLQILSEEWGKSYSILTYLQDFELGSVFNEDVICTIDNDSMHYKSQSASALLLELAAGHLISRAIRFVTNTILMEKLDSQSAVTIDEWQRFLLQEFPRIILLRQGLHKIATLLHRYGIIIYQNYKNTIHENKYSKYLFINHEETLAPAMAMITEPWWGAASCLNSSLQKDTLSAFEAYNQQTFDQVYFNQNSPFNKGMAAISCLEDYDVAISLSEFLKNVDTVVDIGGGEGGLLYQLWSIDPGKKYVLFEKTPETGDLPAAIESIKQKIQSRYSNKFQPEIILGDFYQEKHLNNIPKYDNAMYIIKCTLHNIHEEENIIKVLKNINEVANKDSLFCLAERFIPSNCTIPHFNQNSNMLMRLLFKADERTNEF
jgi:hypothetical protein